jgi:phage FluMu gp28-like protein
MEETSPNTPFHQMRMEIRIRRKNKIGRIKVLAANPRTARGFSGDLILDEFAFHEDSAAIWEAAEPILASNPDFRCRIASTGNGKHNMFYRMASGVRIAECGTRNEETNNNGALFTSAAGFTVSRVTRTAAWEQGVKIYDLKNKRESISPEAARAQALDKAAYDQNYECAFADENMTLLTYELISAAQSDFVTIDAQEWSQASIARMTQAQGRLEIGNDIGRNRDLSMVTVIEHTGPLRRVVAMLKMENLRLPDQQRQLAVVCRMPKFHAYCGDMTGLGLGLVEFLQDQFGRYRIHGVNFSSTERASDRIKLEGRKAETARVTEIMAVNLLACLEDRTIRDLPNDPALTDDLRKPEKITSPGGRVSIAATRDEAGHADGFWSLALAVRAGEVSGGGFGWEHIDLPHRYLKGRGWKGIIA